MKTQAAILVAQKEPLVVEEIEVPRVGHGQVLVRVMSSGICGSQLGEIDGVKGPDRYLPHLLGHEGGGVVLEVGPGVSTVKAGDRVVLHWRKGDGLEAHPARYSWRGKPLNAGWITTFNRHAVVSENRATSVPADISFETAALLGCAVLTGMGVIGNDARLAAGESLVVFGAGGVGLSVIQGAVLAGARPIIAVDIHEGRLALAGRVGATHLVDSTKRSAEEAVRAVLGEKGADAVVETTGNVSVIETAYEAAGSQGRVILVGVPRKGEKVSIYTLPLHFGKVLKGSHGGAAMPAEDIPRCVGLIRERRLRPDELISTRVRLEEINTAIARLRSGEIPGRCLIDMPD